MLIVETTRNANGYSRKHDNDISVFDQSIDGEEFEKAVLLLEENESQPLQELNAQEIANYLDFNVRGKTFDDYFHELCNHRMTRNSFTWRLNKHYIEIFQC